MYLIMEEMKKEVSVKVSRSPPGSNKSITLCLSYSRQI
jgi:hypothetical protein